ncbi:DUF6734 family protein [Ascidiimonas aurantiaca]|uniref:DUF6734 family protein n=1 Tax=Ascidiimonas aurantiaca TaxID=1685432 RepID=UPI0030EE9EF6
MKIVHSFWSIPTHRFNNETDEKKYGGWRSQKFMYMSWALSCLRALTWYDRVELVTDHEGARLLIDTLQLPYTRVHTGLDKLNHYSSHLWAVGKLYTYSLQEEPFIHIDNDVFIGSRFPERIEKASLVGQHMELDVGQYALGYSEMLEKNFYMPQFLQEDIRRNNDFKATNAGIIGGNNLDFIKEFTRTAFKFIDTNLNKFTTAVMGSSYAIIYEQYLFGALARAREEAIEYYYSPDEVQLTDFSDFFNLFTAKKYVHFIGEAKDHWECCRNLEHQLALEYPDHYEKIMSVV